MGICLFIAIGTNRRFVHQPDLLQTQEALFRSQNRFSDRCSETIEDIFQNITKMKGFLSYCRSV